MQNCSTDLFLIWIFQTKLEQLLPLLMSQEGALLQSPLPFCPQTPRLAGRQAGTLESGRCVPHLQGLSEACRALPSRPLPTLRGLFSGEGGHRRERLQTADQGPTPPAQDPKLRQIPEPGSPGVPVMPGQGLRAPAANTKSLQRPAGPRREAAQGAGWGGSAARLALSPSSPCPQVPTGTERFPLPPNTPRDLLQLRTAAARHQGLAGTVLFPPAPAPRAHGPERPLRTPSSGAWRWFRPSWKTVVTSQDPFIGNSFRRQSPPPILDPTGRRWGG